MRGTVINTGQQDPNQIFNYATGVAVNNELRDVLNRGQEHFLQRIGSYNHEFSKRLEELHRETISKNYLDITNMLLSKSQVALGDTHIVYTPVDNLHEANYFNRGYIMSEPTINKLYNNNRCSGFDDGWFDNDPNVSSKWRDNYLEVINGIYDPDLEYEDNIVHTVTDSSNEKDLTFIEQSTILNMWRAMKDMIAVGYDPTDLDKGKL